MLKVGALIKYLSENNPQATPARLTFYHYLTNLAEPDSDVTPELLESFFATCLDYAHWQQNRGQLSSEVRDFLVDQMDLSGVKWPEETQVVELENMSDFTDALQAYLNAIYKKGEKYRLIVEADKKIMAVVLNPDHSICVRTFDRKMMIRHGQLEPLKKDLAIYYTPDLDLDPTHIQRVELAPFVLAQFQVGSEGLNGSLVRGYLCQKFFALQGENIASYPKLFYTVKKLEQYFINRQTDPFYQQIVSSLERTIENVRLGYSEAIQESTDILAQAQNAIDFVFTGDKLLNLLVRDLQHTLAQRRSGDSRQADGRIANNNRVVRTPQKVEESWNQKQQKQSQPQPSPRRGPKFDLTN